jgi:hypothetical protein
MVAPEEKERPSNVLHQGFFRRYMIPKIYCHVLSYLIKTKTFVKAARRLPNGKLPDFLIIGAQKSGTTSLWKHLKKHPHIEMSPNFVAFSYNHHVNRKETHFFNRNWHKGVNWYANLFNDNNKLQGEVTPTYISSLSCHKRIYETIPNAKLVLVLRDPVTRAYSQFNNTKQAFPYAKNQLLLPYQGLRENILATIDDDNCDSKVTFIKRGYYIEQIESLLLQYPADQLHIVISERMRGDMNSTYDKLFSFLGVENVHIEFELNTHKRAYKEELNEEDEKLLYDIYKPYNEKLFQFLGYEIEEWRH